MKKGYKLISLICVLVCAAFIVLCFPKSGETADIEKVEPKVEVETEAEAKPYVSPIDFKGLQKKNSDTYAWIKIDGTVIDYPVFQSPTDDAFYLNHNGTKEYDACGVLYSEHTYNSNDFSDPVTVIYGHHLKNGKMFGNLQQYYTDDFNKYTDIVIYTPTEEIHYQVFAAVPFSNRHILYYYDCFKDSLSLKEFVSDINSVRAIGSYVDKSVEILPEDQLLVLSTCLQGDRTCRFLVVAKRIINN